MGAGCKLLAQEEHFYRIATELNKTLGRGRKVFGNAFGDWGIFICYKFCADVTECIRLVHSRSPSRNELDQILRVVVHTGERIAAREPAEQDERRTAARHFVCYRRKLNDSVSCEWAESV